MTSRRIHQFHDPVCNGADVGVVVGSGHRQVIGDIESGFLLIIKGRSTSLLQNCMFRNHLVHSHLCFEVTEAAIIADCSGSQHPVGIGSLPEILADQLTDIGRNTGQDCRFRAAVQLDPTQVLLAFQHSQNRHHILAPYHLVFLQAVLIDLIDRQDHLIQHLNNSSTQFHGNSVLRCGNICKDALKEPLVQSLQPLQQIRKAAVFLLGFGYIVFQDFCQSVHIVPAQFHTIGTVGCFHQPMGFVDDDVIAFLQQVIATVRFQLLGHEEHIMIGHLNVACTAGFAILHVLIVPTHDSLRTVPAGARHTNLLLQVIGDINFVQIKAVECKIQFIEHIDQDLILLRVPAQFTHHAEIPPQAEVMILTLANDNPQGLIDDSHLHQSSGELGDFLLHQFPLQVNAGGCDGDGILCVLVGRIHPGCEICRSQIAHGLAGTNTCLIQGDLLFDQPIQHGFCHLDLILTDRKTKLRHNTAEQNVHVIFFIDFAFESHSPGMPQFMAHRIDHIRYQQGVILIAETDLAIQNAMLDSADLVKHLIARIYARHAMEDHIAIHQGEVIVIGHTHNHSQRQFPELQSIFLIDLKHSNNSLSIPMSASLRTSILS